MPRCIVLTATLSWSALALAQGALDAGLQVGSKSNAAARQEDFRSRNLVVTGDVAAGRGFRGSVGYSAEGDFRGATGSDASIDFRRSSALSNPALATGSVGAGASFSIGRDSVSSLEYRRDYVGPGSTGQGASRAAADMTRQRLDRLTTRMSSSELRDAEGQSMPMARYQGREGEQGVLLVSEVRGVKKERDRDNLAGTGERLSLYEAARLREDLRTGLLTMDSVRAKSSNPFELPAPADSVNATSVREPRQPTRTESASQPAVGASTQYGRIIRDIEENWRRRSNGGAAPSPTEGDAKTSDASIGSAYERLRRDLGAPDEPKPAASPSDPDIAPKIRIPGEKKSDEARKVEMDGASISLDDYALMLKHGGTLDAFGDGGRDRLDELLAQGQRAMHEGNSFVAEKRFEVVLAMKPNDPRATAGLLHCQIGANLTGSAAITLRSLLARNPEMMDVRFGEQAMPPRERLDRALASVRERISRGSRPAENGLLLAYIGHLLGDQAAIREGLALVGGSPSDETMRALLERLWLAPDAKPAIEPTVSTEAPSAP